MPAERFYVDADLAGHIALAGPELHHLAHVMRVSVGEEVELVNGRGALAQARLLSLSKKSAELEILSVTQTPVLSPRLILAVPVLRLAKLEWIIEKGTELGADAFWLYAADFSEKESLSPHQQERLSHIAISAMKQCGRLDLPSLRVFSDLQKIFSAEEAAYMYGDTHPQAPKIKAPTGKVVFITGPEKGFSEKERTFLQKRAIGVSLHRNILRAETAPLVALCLLNPV